MLRLSPEDELQSAELETPSYFRTRRADLAGSTQEIPPINEILRKCFAFITDFQRYTKQPYAIVDQWRCLFKQIYWENECNVKVFYKNEFITWLYMHQAPRSCFKFLFAPLNSTQPMDYHQYLCKWARKTEFTGAIPAPEGTSPYTYIEAGNLFAFLQVYGYKLPCGLSQACAHEYADVVMQWDEDTVVDYLHYWYYLLFHKGCPKIAVTLFFSNAVNVHKDVTKHHPSYNKWINRRKTGH